MSTMIQGKNFIWLPLVMILLAAAPAAAQDEVRDLVVKIHTTRRDPDLTRPWTKQNPASVSGSGRAEATRSPPLHVATPCPSSKEWPRPPIS